MLSTDGRHVQFCELHRALDTRLGTQQQLDGHVLFCGLRRALDTRLHASALTSILFTVTLSRKTMMGVPKGPKSSDSWKKAFVRKVREIGVTVNWSISMLVVREGY